MAMAMAKAPAALRNKADPRKPPPSTEEDWGRSGPGRKAEQDGVPVPSRGSHSQKTFDVFAPSKQNPAQKGAGALQPIAQVSCEPAARFVGILPQNPARCPSARCSASLLIPKEMALPLAWYLPALGKGRNTRKVFFKEVCNVFFVPSDKRQELRLAEKGIFYPKGSSGFKNTYTCISAWKEGRRKANH